MKSNRGFVLGLMLWIAPLSAHADKSTDSFWYCGATFEVDSTRSEASEPVFRFGNGPFLVKKLSSATTPLLLTLYPGQPFSELNIPISFSQSQERFEFNSEVLHECQDYDCEGITKVQGFLKRDSQPRSLGTELHITFTFFKDFFGEVKTWTKTVIFKGRPNDRSFCI